jgi:hypothetical protein
MEVRRSLPTLVTDKSFTVMEDFFNGSIGCQSVTLQYSIIGAGQ